MYRWQGVPQDHPRDRSVGRDYYGPPLADEAEPAALDEVKLAPRIVRRQIAHLECNECGQTFTRSAKRLRLSGERCPKCGGYDTEIS